MSKQKNNYYAVRKGRKIGIYDNWNACKQQISGFSRAEFKGFPTKEEAEVYLNAKIQSNNKLPAEVVSYVDGSYNAFKKVYGYGGFLEYKNKKGETEKIIIQGNGKNSEMASMRNVAGEILGSQAAIEKAIEMGFKSIDVYYDYKGIECWATGEWRRNKIGTIAYYDFIQSVRDIIDIRFHKVKGHTGVDGNELADALAKEAVGLA